MRFHGEEQQKLAGVAFFACGAVEGGAPPTVFLIEPAGNLSVEAAGTLQLKAEVYAPGGAVDGVEFYADALKIGEAKAPPYACTWNYQRRGHRPSFCACAWRRRRREGPVAGGGGGVQGQGRGEAEAGPQPGRATMPRPRTAPPATITLAATALRTEAAVTKVEFFIGSAKLGEATAAPFQFQWARIAAGEYPVTATATLAGGEQVKAEAMTVVVAAPDEPAADGGDRERRSTATRRRPAAG